LRWADESGFYGRTCMNIRASKTKGCGGSIRNSPMPGWRGLTSTFHSARIGTEGAIIANEKRLLIQAPDFVTDRGLAICQLLCN
jgi:hypothetical protein